MPRRKNTPPRYCFHRSSGQAYVRLDGRDVYLGKFDSPESRQEYARLVGAWLRGESGIAPPPSQGQITIAEALDRYWEHCLGWYRQPDGTLARTSERIKSAVRFLREHSGHRLAAEFSALDLEGVQMAMISRNWSRTYVNYLTSALKSAFRWLSKAQLIPPSVYHSLLAVEGVPSGRMGVREGRKVKPVAVETVQASLAQTLADIRDLAQVQYLTAARPGEIFSMRPMDIRFDGSVPDGPTFPGLWVYCPEHHKTAYRGHVRVIFLGPQVQAILRPYLDECQPAETLFSPRRAVARWLKEKRRLRKSSVQPSQTSRAKKSPKKRPGERYCRYSYAQAIERACARAKVMQWAPYALRHTRATEIRSQFGPDAARIVLGHSLGGVTGGYAEASLEKAAEVMRKIG